MIEISEEIKKTLKDIGLDRTETQVYVLLLKEGLLSIQEISNKLKLPRSSIHLACENLLSKGVVKISKTGKRRNFYVEKPKDIENFINYQEDKIQSSKLAISSILSRLTAIHITSKESEPIDIEELEGEDGFVETYYRSLKQPKNSEIIHFGGDPSIFTAGRSRIKKYTEKRMKKKIYSRLLIPNYEFSKHELKEARFKMRDVRILKKEIFDPKINASIWQDHISITVWDKGLHSVIIRNKAIADFMKQLFEIAWSQAKK